MPLTEKKKAIIALLFAEGLSLLGALSGLPFFLYLVPFVFIWLGLSVRDVLAYLSAGLFFVTLGLFIAEPFGLLSGLFLGLLPVLVGVLLRREIFLEDVLMKGTILSFSALLLIHYQFRSFFGINLYTSYMEGMKETLKGLPQALALDPGPLLERVSLYYPSFLFIGSLTLILLFLGAGMMLRRSRLVNFPRQNLGQFRFRRLSLSQTFSLILFVFLLQGMGKTFSMLGANMLVILMVLFGLQGMSVLYYYLKQRRFPGFFIGVILLTTLILPYVQQVLGMLGMIDSFVDLRKMEKAQ